MHHSCGSRLWGDPAVRLPPGFPAVNINRLRLIYSDANGHVRWPWMRRKGVYASCTGSTAANLLAERVRASRALLTGLGLSDIHEEAHGGERQSFGGRSGLRTRVAATVVG